MRVATVVFGVVKGSVRMKEMVRLLFLRCVKKFLRRCVYNEMNSVTSEVDEREGKDDC
ncbi:hypothetical protein COLO4_07714 [Corchorus olitorius]|uniref:Uncharacterized protein n=1 Tax=Corchorus olitorius TaxID=93759 RepID=A0A1R3KIW4_9ROSI|nr:hypothetical protein COLO4_07714 [Corchorus olitorius]